MALYHVSTCRLLYRYTLSIIGIIIGLSAAGCFGGVFHNYHAAGWGLVSGVFALLAFILHAKVRRDTSCSIRPAFFIRLKKIGLLGAVLGVGVFIGYLIKGILVRETGKYPSTYETFCKIWYHLYNLKSNIPPWVFFMFFKLFNWYQIA